MPKRKLSEEPIYYVYALVDPRDGQTFYIGKGKLRRAYQHVVMVRKNVGKNDAKCARIREILAAGLDVCVVKIAEGLTEGRAYGLEATLIAEQKAVLTNGATSLLEGVRTEHARAVKWCNAFRWNPEDWLITYRKKFGKRPEPFEVDIYKRMRMSLLTNLLMAKEELEKYEPPKEQEKSTG